RSRRLVSESLFARANPLPTLSRFCLRWGCLLSRTCLVHARWRHIQRQHYWPVAFLAPIFCSSAPKHCHRECRTVFARHTVANHSLGRVAKERDKPLPDAVVLLVL